MRRRAPYSKRKKHTGATYYFLGYLEAGAVVDELPGKVVEAPHSTSADTWETSSLHEALTVGRKLSQQCEIGVFKVGHGQTAVEFVTAFLDGEPSPRLFGHIVQWTEDGGETWQNLGDRLAIEEAWEMLDAYRDRHGDDCGFRVVHIDAPETPIRRVANH